MLYDEDVKTTHARVELEMSIGWATENPTLFKEHYNRFFDENQGKDITAKTTKGFLTLIAKVAA